MPLVHTVDTNTILRPESDCLRQQHQNSTLTEHYCCRDEIAIACSTALSQLTGRYKKSDALLKTLTTAEHWCRPVRRATISPSSRQRGLRSAKDTQQAPPAPLQRAGKHHVRQLVPHGGGRAARTAWRQGRPVPPCHSLDISATAGSSQCMCAPSHCVHCRRGAVASGADR